MDARAFVGVAGRWFEHSPWVAERAAGKRPFASIGAMQEAMSGVVRAASAEEQMGLIRAHPDLVGRLAREGRLTAESTVEQKAAGLTALTPEEVEQFERHNAAYRERFGFPFIICARENKKDAILAAFPLRLRNSKDQEIAAALTEIDKIAGLRIRDALWED
jgi:OHCU decarboxylase